MSPYGLRNAGGVGKAAGAIGEEKAMGSLSSRSGRAREAQTPCHHTRLVLAARCVPPSAFSVFGALNRPSSPEHFNFHLIERCFHVNSK